MKSIWWIISALAAILLASAGFCDNDFVTAKGSKLYLHGKEYRAIGVNVPHLHQAYFGTWLHIKQKYGNNEKAKQVIIDAITDAEKSGVAFIRFFAFPGYPRDIDMLYAKDKDQYWKQMDELFALCRKHHIRLVPSLGCISGWQPYYNEVGQAILDPGSKTYKASYEYIKEFVTRYKDDPTVLMWELANETMLASDVDRQGEKALPVETYTPGVIFRETLTREDSLTWDMIMKIYREQAAYIKQLDPNHPVTSGDAAVRQECTSRRETFPDFKYRNDTFREWIGNNLVSQQEPLDVFSYHIYGTSKPGSDSGFKGISHMDMMRGLVRATHASGAPVFIGELGQFEPSFKDDPNAVWTRQSIDVLEKEGVSLAAIWVWHFSWQPELTVDSTTSPLLVKRIAAFNKKHSRW